MGRSNRMAYAFLLYRRDKLLKEVAEKRLAAIREFTDLGSGIKIAMRDLEIRGAGNLLGEAQSGHMEAVGYDMYCKMLNEAVLQLKGTGEEENYTTTIDLNIDAYIPESYIKNEYQKLDVYREDRCHRDGGRDGRYDGGADRPVRRYPEEGSAAPSYRGAERPGSLCLRDGSGAERAGLYALPCMRRRRSIRRRSPRFSRPTGTRSSSARKSRRIFCIRSGEGAEKRRGRMCFSC